MIAGGELERGVISLRGVGAVPLPDRFLWPRDDAIHDDTRDVHFGVTSRPLGPLAIDHRLDDQPRFDRERLRVPRLADEFGNARSREYRDDANHDEDGKGANHVESRAHRGASELSDPHPRQGPRAQPLALCSLSGRRWSSHAASRIVAAGSQIPRSAAAPLGWLPVHRSFAASFADFSLRDLSELCRRSEYRDVFVRRAVFPPVPHRRPHRESFASRRTQE